MRILLAVSCHPADGAVDHSANARLLDVGSVGSLTGISTALVRTIEPALQLLQRRIGREQLFPLQ
jgi:hypothetical protein